MSREIQLTKGAVTIVDDADYTWLNQWKWFLSDQGYAVRSPSYARRARMHREILAAPPDMEVDHINRDRLDNRRFNLRLCTDAQGSRNRSKQASRAGRKCSSKYKGVCWDKRSNCWRAYTSGYHLGYFEDEEDAARAYNKVARELHGEFASLNEEVVE